MEEKHSLVRQTERFGALQRVALIRILDASLHESRFGSIMRRGEISCVLVMQHIDLDAREPCSKQPQLLFPIYRFCWLRLSTIHCGYSGLPMCVSLCGEVSRGRGVFVCQFCATKLLATSTAAAQKTLLLRLVRHLSTAWLEAAVFDREVSQLLRNNYWKTCSTRKVDDIEDPSVCSRRCGRRPSTLKSLQQQLPKSSGYCLIPGHDVGQNIYANKSPQTSRNGGFLSLPPKTELSDIFTSGNRKNPNIWRIKRWLEQGAVCTIYEL